ncbi:MAG TPA: polysaccharide pyruvyl transferase family protein [Thermoleophilia bacterium]|nr:polysaccharide pyruvyl transferase family protein [Thermoleophilia bacterium]
MNNFGDLITEAVLCWLGAKKVRNVYSSSLDRGPALVGAGSILDRLQYPSAVVWGSGFMMGGIPDESAKPAEPMEVVALRGPRSRDIAKQLGWKSTELFCDPGLLLSMMYKPGDKKYEVGFVPHYWHAKSARTSDYTGSVKVIDVLQSVPSVVAELTSCKVVISTSLHGVIAAHSFGIPWVWAKMEPALIGDYFKFYDFMEGMGISAQPVSLAPEEVEEETLLRLAKGARLPEGQNIAEKQRSLLTGLRDCTTLRNLPLMDELPSKHES